MFNKLLKLKMQAFSLLEIAISLSVIGILVIGVMKGQDLLEQARIEKTRVQIEALILSVETFKNTYKDLPGSYNGPIFQEKGSGDGKIEQKDLFWKHLHSAGLIPSSEAPICPAGGKFDILNENGKNWLILSNGARNGAISPQVAGLLKSKIDENAKLDEGFIIIKDSEDKPGKCIASGNLQSTKDKVCILYIELP